MTALLVHLVVLLVVNTYLLSLAMSCSLVTATVDNSSKSPDARMKVIARTMELGFRILLDKWEFVVMPRKHPDYPKLFNTYLDLNQTTIPPFLQIYDPSVDKNMYGMLINNVPIFPGNMSGIGKYNFVAEGQNEHGLTISLLALTGSRYQLIENASCVKQEGSNSCSGKKKNIVSWVDFIPYILARCKTGQEVVDELEKNVLLYRPEAAASLGSHFAVDDANGDQFIIEYLDNELVWYKTDLGVMTNDPSFSWHVQNLNRYNNVQAPRPVTPESMLKKQPSNVYPKPVFDVVPKTISHGTGGIGLPGDTSPPSRFVLLFYLSSLAHANAPPQDYTESLALATNLINAVAIPFGSVGGKSDRSSENSSTDANEQFKITLSNLLSDVELAQWTVLKVPKKKVIFYRDYVHMTWKKIELGKLDFSEGALVKHKKVHDENESFGTDITFD